MKTLFTCFFAVLFSLSLQAQPNNPYDQTGRDFVKSCQILMAELTKGGIKTIDEPAIKKMQSMIPSKTQMNPSLAGEIMKNVKQDPLPLSSVLKNSSLKPEVQREISLMIEHGLSTGNEEHRK